MQRPHQLATPDLPISLCRLSKQLRAVLQSDNGVDPRIEFLDVIEIRRHDLDAGDLPGANGIAKRHRVQHHDARGPRRSRRVARKRGRRGAQRRASGDTGGQT